MRLSCWKKRDWKWKENVRSVLEGQATNRRGWRRNNSLVNVSTFPKVRERRGDKERDEVHYRSTAGQCQLTFTTMPQGLKPPTPTHQDTQLSCRDKHSEVSSKSIEWDSYLCDSKILFVWDVHVTIVRQVRLSQSRKGAATLTQATARFGVHVTLLLRILKYLQRQI